MHLERLDLVNYRSYADARIDVEPGVSVLIGANGQGKTNLVEAAHYLAIGASHRVSADAPLVRFGEHAAVVRAAAVVQAGRQLTVELEIRPTGRNRGKVNGQPQARTREALGLIRSVLFAPEDLQLVRGDPAERRRFLDHLLTQRRPAYLAARQDYDRVLRQRNALLKDSRGRDPFRSPGAELQTWTESLAVTGATVLAARIAVVHALAQPVADAYRQLADDPDRSAAMVYQLSTGRAVPAEAGAGVPDPGELARELREGLEGLAAAERQRGITLAGPHRDELALALGTLPAKGYASHGETWSLALALRLASREVLRDVGEEPIVLLDDVFAELDLQRRRRLAARCAEFEQVVVTAAVDEDVPLAGRRYLVEAGIVAPVGAGRSRAGGDGAA